MVGLHRRGIPKVSRATSSEHAVLLLGELRLDPHSIPVSNLFTRIVVWSGPGVERKFSKIRIAELCPTPQPVYRVDHDAEN
jgi:hypothetical protein